MMQRKKLKLLLASLAASTILFSVPLSVMAGSLDNDSTQTGSTDPDGSDDSTTTTSDYSLTNSCNPNCKHEYSGDLTQTIKVMGGTHKLIFNNVKISPDTTNDNSAPALEVTTNSQNGSTSNVTLEVNGTNNLTSPAGFAGIRVTSGNSLTIIGTGDLTATGGSAGAGIGNQGFSGSSGEITIATTGSSKITANGGDAAAGIGGGQAGGCGKITVKSGTVYANGGNGYVVSGTTNKIDAGTGIGTGGKGTGGGEIVLEGGEIHVSGGTSIGPDGATTTGGVRRDGIDCKTLSSNDGSANLYSNSAIAVGTNIDEFNGIVWTPSTPGNEMGMVYGDAVLNVQLNNKSLNIRPGCSVTIPDSISDITLNGGIITGDETTSIINADRLNVANGDLDDRINQKVTLAWKHISITDPSPTYNRNRLNPLLSNLDEQMEERAYTIARTWTDPLDTDTSYEVDTTGWKATFRRGSADEEEINKAGDYTVEYSNPNYDSFDFKISVKHKELTKDMISIENVPYTGKYCTPSPIVKDGKIELKEGIDYQKIDKNNDYKNNKDVSTESNPAKIVIKASANGSYIGTVEKDFFITAASLANAEITLEPSSTVYNGKKQEPKTITVTLPSEDADNPIELVEGTDYEIVTSAEPKNAGTIEYTIKGIEGGNYTGTSSKAATYVIEKKSISIVPNSSATIENKVYDGTNKFKLSGVKLSGVEGDDKVEIVSGSVSGSDVGSYSEITFDASDLAGDSSSNYTLEEGGKITLSTPVEITPRTPKDAAPNNRQHTVSTTNNQRFACVIEIDKEDGVDLEEYQFQMDDGAPVPGSLDPNNPNKVICSFDGIEPESTHTFHVSTKGASKNIVAKEIGSKEVTFEKLKNPKEDVPGFELSINEGNADKKTYTITMPKVDDPDVEYRIIAVGSEEDTPYDSIKTDKTDCKPGTKYIGQMRYKETAVYKASEPVSSPELTTPKSPLADSGPKYKTKWKRIIPNQSDSIELPDALKDAEYASMQEVTTDLTRHLSGLGAYQDQEHTAFYDVTIQVITRNDAGEPETRDAQPGDFEDGGIPVTLPAKSLPQGVVATENQFSAAHMFASNDFAEYSAGEIETCLSSEGSEVFQGSGKGVTFVVNGTSPVGIAWSTAPEEPTDPEDPNNPNNPEDPNNPDNNDPNNPDNNDPNNPDGTDPNNPDGNNGDANAADPNANNAADPNAANADGTDANGEDAKSAAQSAVDALKSAAASLLPKTGDTSKIIMWVVAAVAACIAVIAVLRSKAKKGKKAKSSSSAKTSATAKKTAATTAKKPSSTTAKKTTVKKPASGSAKKTTTTKKGR